MLGKDFVCPVCKERIMPYEIALYLGGKDNLVKLFLKNDYVFVHTDCLKAYGSTSDLVKELTNGEEDLSYLED